MALDTTLKNKQLAPSEEPWTPDSWKNKKVYQSPPYPNQQKLDYAVEMLKSFPPLVTSWEIERLKSHIADAAIGKRFILQGGDCAELFSECNPEIIANKLKILLQMSLVLVDGLKKPIIRVGRMAGQYAKPRSKNIETKGEQSCMSYFGDLINEAEFTPSGRSPNPNRLISAYQYSAMTLNFIRALIDGGFTDLHHPEYWDLNFFDKTGMRPELRADYLRRATNLANALDVMEAMTNRPIEKLSQVEFYTSHEGLSLNYESAVTRTVPRRSGYYNLGCHLPWIGERTRQPEGAHMEYFRGICNPIGLKVGPTIKPEELVKLAKILDPDKEPGRLVIIARFGKGKAGGILPGLVETLRETGRQPAWTCDPMHGNTVSTKSGTKTRHIDDILTELAEHIDAHESVGSVLGGVHFELTAENVTECVGGASGVTEDDLATCYQSLCDPRLNYEQSMEIAFAIAKRMES